MTIKQMLDGKKFNIACLFGVGYALFAYLNHEFTSQEAFQYIWVSVLGLAGRSTAGKIEKALNGRNGS